MIRALFLFSILAAAEALAGGWTVDGTTSLPAPSALTFQRIDVSNGDRQVRVHATTFSARTCSFALMDDPAGAYDLGTASKKRGALAAVNGGYFHPDRTPLGLRVRQGAEIHPLEKARLLSGLMTVAGGRIALQRVGEFKRAPGLREAVQAGPFLVDRGLPVAGLNATKRDPRTVIIADGSDRFGLVTVNDATLAEAGAILATPGVLGKLSVQRALNLDGGSSTGFWVASDPPFYQREWRDVRDFVAIVPR